MAWSLRSGGGARGRDANRSPRPAPTPDRSDREPVPQPQPVRDLIRGLPGTTLVLASEPEVLHHLPRNLDEIGARLVHLWEHDLPDEWPVDEVPAWDSVLLVTVDRSTLRRVAPELPDTGPASAVGVWLTAARNPLVVVPRPEWTSIQRLTADRLTRPGRGVSTIVEFVRPARSRRVLHEFAAQAVHAPNPYRSGLVTAYAGRPVAPGLDLRTLVLTDLTDLADAVDEELVVPPDVIIAAPSTPTELPTHPIKDRAPLVVTDPGLDPVDEMVFSPRGWKRVPTLPDTDLATLAGPAGVTEAMIPKLQRHRAVRLDLSTTPTADLLKLTIAGIPVLVTGSDPLLAPELSALLAKQPDLDDSMERDGWSVKLRRATFDHHSTSAWRAGLATRAGLTRLGGTTAGLPGVSVLLATKRPDELEGAVARVAAQVGAEVELVIATHGFVADPARVTDILGRPPVLLDFDADVLFGDVLTGAARAASFDVVMKMDDDDWYSPHAVHDLLMARRVTGADVVGSPAEFVHLAEFDETVRRTHNSECYSTFVAGGTLTLSRSLLRDVGWFRPVRRSVDGQLLSMVLASGGTVYRAHGFNYVLRRNATGHTWDSDAESFRTAETLDRTWHGFRPPEEAL